jgi:hypothetical protein
MKNILFIVLLFTLNTSVLAHSGRTDSNGGHNCSDKSKRKGLCTGYHYHKKPKAQQVDIKIDKALEEKELKKAS